MLKTNLDFEVEPTFGELLELDVKGILDISDTVKVVRGDLKNLVGKISNLSGNSALIEKDGNLYEVNKADLEKNFDIGQEVSYMGENGVVLRILNRKVTLGMDEFTREVECSIDDLKQPMPERRLIKVEPTRYKVRRDVLINKYVTVTEGPYKGLQGLVKDYHQNKYTIQLRSNLKSILVDKSAIFYEEKPTVSTFVTDIENIGGKTPTFKTPAQRTPAHQTPSHITTEYRFEEAGTGWLETSVYYGALVYANDKMHTLQSYEDLLYKTVTGEEFIGDEISFCRPENYDKAIIMVGDKAGTEGFVSNISGGECTFTFNNDSMNIELSKLTKKQN